LRSLNGTASTFVGAVGGARRIKLKKAGHFLGTFVAPDGDLKLGKWADLNGALYGLEVNAKKGAEITGEPALELFVDMFFP
jgi:hypothetical protein